MNNTAHHAGNTARIAAVIVGVVLFASCAGSDTSTGDSTVTITDIGFADTPSTTAPTGGTTPIDKNGALACDGSAIQAAIDDPDFVTFDEIGCADGWAGAGYLDSENSYTPVILRAEGQRWVLQDWSTVCDRYPDISSAAKIYCPGG